MIAGFFSGSLLGCTAWEVEALGKDGAGPGEETESGSVSSESGSSEASGESGTDRETGDSETGAVPELVFEGGSSVLVHHGLDLRCEVEATLAGSRYVGSCEGCDFEIRMEATPTAGDPDACDGIYPTYSFIEDADVANLVLGYAAEYVLYEPVYLSRYWVVEYDYQGLGGYRKLLSGYLEDYRVGTADVTRSGDEVSWSYEMVGLEMPYYSECAGVAEDAAETASEALGTGSIACEGLTVDVWEFVAGGAEVVVTVDTVAADSTFDARMWVQDSTGCTIGYSDDAFACAFPPPNYGCPSLSFVDLVPGASYEVVVASLGDCTGETVDYLLAIDTAMDLVLRSDDVAAGTSVVVTGSGRLSL